MWRCGNASKRAGMAHGESCVTAVAFRTPLDAELCVSLVGSTLKFLLYMRGQVPCAFDELERIAADCRETSRQQSHVSRSRPGGPARKAVKCVDAVDHVLREGLPSIFAGRVLKVAVVLGASLLSPREAVVMDFGDVTRVDVDSMPRPAASVAAPTPMPKEKLARLCGQKLLRALVVDGIFQRDADLAVTRAHIAVLAAKQHGQVIPGFQPKQTFSLRLPRKKQQQDDRTHWIRLSTDSGSDAASTSAGSSPDTHNVAHFGTEQGCSTDSIESRDEDSLIWYVLEKPIQGFAGAL